MTTATVSEIQHVTPADLFLVRPFTPHCEVIRTAADQVDPGTAGAHHRG